MNETLKRLKGVRGLLERGWCQGAYARDEDGAICPAWSERAVRFCLSGACYRVGMNTSPRKDIKHHLVETAQKMGAPSLPAFNDTHTKAEVLALVDRTIERVEAANGREQD